MRSCAVLMWVMAARTRASLQAVLCVECPCDPLGPAHVPGAGLCELRAAEMGQEQLIVSTHHLWGVLEPGRGWGLSHGAQCHLRSSVIPWECLGGT